MTPSRLDLVLAGPSASGKSAVGRALARFLARPFLDLDDAIVAREGASVVELFSRGEEVFREAEAAALGAWVGRPAGAPPEVLALGGGALENRALAQFVAQRAVIVHLDAAPEELAARLSPDEVKARPLLVEASELVTGLAKLREARQEGYAIADISVDTSGMPPDMVAVAALRALYDDKRGPWREPVRTLETADDRSTHSVTTGRGAVTFAPAPAASLLWDEGLPEVHTERLLPQLETLAEGRLIRIPRRGGEGAKTPASLLAAWRDLLAGEVDPDVPLWVVGGGTLTDLGGLVAATFKRGLPLDLLPTTLVAQLDAALGGKNAVNLDGTKNIVGVVRLPRSVHLDPLFLLTLSDDDLRAGLAEAVKSALVGDPDLLGLIESRRDDVAGRPLPVLEEIVARAARVKLAVVARDLYDQGGRRVLNLGHTLAHALEAATRGLSRPLGHGESVAIGMVFAARLARRLGQLADLALPERLEHLLAGLGLPIRPPLLADAERDRLRAALQQDKKRRGGENVWVLPAAPGRVLFCGVARPEIEAELEEFCRCAPS